MLGVLAIMGVLTIGGIAGFNWAMDRWRANRIIDGVEERALVGSRLRLSGMNRTMEIADAVVAQTGGTIEDYATTVSNTGYNDEKTYFSVQVAGVSPQVCENVMNLNWQLPVEVYAGNTQYTGDTAICAGEGTVDLTFVFAADLITKKDVKVVDRNNPTCQPTQVWTCKTNNANGYTCCTAGMLCLADGEEPSGVSLTNKGDCPRGTHQCRNNQCVCRKSCPAGQNQDPKTCACSSQTCETGVWNEAKGECVECNEDTDCAGRTDGKTTCDTTNNVCKCPGLPQRDSACTYTTGIDENGCPTQTLSHCDCPSDKTYNNGKTPCDESQYDVEYQRELADGTTCYQCRKKEVCEAGYTLEKCSETIVQSYPLSDGRICYQCTCSSGICCPDGFICWDGKPEICPVGYYCKSGGKHTCPGKSATSYGTGFSTAEECRNCDNGYISVDKQQCLEKCSNGSYSQDGLTCITCPKGSYCINNEKYDCDPEKGEYVSETGSASCSICPNGKYTKDGKSCIDCPTGYTCENGIRRGCKASEGYIGQNNVCTRCGNGRFALPNGDGFGIRCESCKAGFACMNGVATACDPTKGEVSEKTQQTSCAICGVGKYAQTASSCASCPAGQYCANGKIAGDCVAANGQMSEAGASSCTVCAEGTYAKPSNNTSQNGTSCAICPAGRYCSDGKIAGDCWASDGKMSKTGASSCTVCAEGKYAKAVSKNDDHGTSCYNCPTGKTCSGGKILD